MMSQAVSPSTVTQSPEPTHAWALLSSHAPVVLTSAMQITAICLLQGTKGLLAPRILSLPQVAAFPRVLEPRGSKEHRSGQEENQGSSQLTPTQRFPPPGLGKLVALVTGR